jgi:hypothetical protein
MLMAGQTMKQCVKRRSGWRVKYYVRSKSRWMCSGGGFRSVLERERLALSLGKQLCGSANVVEETVGGCWLPFALFPRLLEKCDITRGSAVNGHAVEGHGFRTGPSVTKHVADVGQTNFEIEGVSGG